MNSPFWLFDQLGGLVTGVAISLICALLMFAFLLCVIAIIGEFLWIAARIFCNTIRWFRNFPKALRECLTYRHCSIPGCQGQHRSHG